MYSVLQQLLQLHDGGDAGPGLCQPSSAPIDILFDSQYVQRITSLPTVPSFYAAVSKDATLIMSEGKTKFPLLCMLLFVPLFEKCLHINPVYIFC